MRFGDTEIVDLRFGAGQVDRVYLGDQQIWPADPANLIDLSIAPYTSASDPWVVVSTDPLILQPASGSIARGGWTFESVAEAIYRLTFDTELTGRPNGALVRARTDDTFSGSSRNLVHQMFPIVAAGTTEFTAPGGTLWIGPGMGNISRLTINQYFLERIA